MSCIVCKSKVRGRSDKKYCSVHCKNYYHSNRKKLLEYATKEVNSKLISNRSIMEQIVGQTVNQRIISKKLLIGLGFQFEMMTGYRQHPLKKHAIHHVYEFSWTKVNDNMIAIVKNDQTNASPALNPLSSSTKIGSDYFLTLMEQPTAFVNDVETDPPEINASTASST